MATTSLPAPERLLLAAPRGYCAGVDRAVQTVERALELYGAPVYVRKEIVHNKHVVAQLRERGAIFVEELDDTIPEGATTVFSAHGVSPAVHADAKQRNLFTLDATCPLVTKVHVEAKKFAAEGYTIVLIGHEGHEEVEGTMGEAPQHFVLVETEEDVDTLELDDPDRVAFLTQTTLSVVGMRRIDYHYGLAHSPLVGRFRRFCSVLPASRRLIGCRRRDFAAKKRAPRFKR